MQRAGCRAWTRARLSSARAIGMGQAESHLLPHVGGGAPRVRGLARNAARALPREAAQEVKTSFVGSGCKPANNGALLCCRCNRCDRFVTVYHGSQFDALDGKLCTSICAGRDTSAGRDISTYICMGAPLADGSVPLAIALESVLRGFGIRTLEELAAIILSEDRDDLVEWIKSNECRQEAYAAWQQLQYMAADSRMPASAIPLVPLTERNLRELELDLSRHSSETELVLGEPTNSSQPSRKPPASATPVDSLGPTQLPKYDKHDWAYTVFAPAPRKRRASFGVPKKHVSTPSPAGRRTTSFWLGLRRLQRGLPRSQAT